MGKGILINRQFIKKNKTVALFLPNVENLKSVLPGLTLLPCRGFICCNLFKVYHISGTEQCSVQVLLIHTAISGGRTFTSFRNGLRESNFLKVTTS